VGLTFFLGVTFSRSAGLRSAGTCNGERRLEMSLARVVEFEGVTKARLEEMKQEMEGGAPPEGVPAKELVVLHDAEAEKAVVVLFFDNEEDYQSGDEALNAMPAEETPGRRASVQKYDVVVRQTV
jgi:hypothetical protein